MFATGLALFVSHMAMPVCADELDDRLATARLSVVRALEEIAAWAVDHRLIGARHRTLRRILEFAPEHAAARASLEFTRTKRDGTWTQSKTYREPADWNKDALPEYESRLTAAFKAYRNDAMGAIELAGDAAGARRGVVLDQLAALLPDDEVVRKARREVRLGAGWVMEETARALTRRAELKALASAAIRAIKTPVVDATWVAKGWKSAFRSKDVLCLGTHDESTCRRTIELCQAYLQFFSTLFGPKFDHAAPTLIVLLRSRNEAKGFMKGREEEAQFLAPEGVNLSSNWINYGGGLVVWIDDPRLAIETVVVQIVGLFLEGQFQPSERGWIEEGIGRTISWNYAEIYGPSFAHLEQTHGKGDGDDAVALPTGDWMPVARDALRTLPVHRFAALLTMRMTAMRALDEVVAYALGSYLMEGRQDKAKAFIEASVASDDAEKVVRSTLGMSVEELLGRVRRWSDEMSVPR